MFIRCWLQIVLSVPIWMVSENAYCNLIWPPWTTFLVTRRCYSIFRIYSVNSSIALARNSVKVYFQILLPSSEHLQSYCDLFWLSYEKNSPFLEERSRSIAVNSAIFQQYVDTLFKLCLKKYKSRGHLLKSKLF